MRSLARAIPDSAVPALLAVPPFLGYGLGGMHWCLGIGGGMAAGLLVWSPWHARRARHELYRRERIEITHADGSKIVMDPPPYSIRERAR